MTEHKIRCRSCRGTHATAAKVRECYEQAASAELEAIAEAKAEAWAEGAWVRHAEGWYRNPDPDEYLDRMTEAYGYGPPPGTGVV